MYFHLIKLLRPQQWIKNLFIFLPLFFDRHIYEWEYLRLSIFAFFAFSFVASAIYCFNDILDVNSDRLHPKKCKRPIASGAISIKQGYLTMIIMLILSAATIYWGFKSNSGTLLYISLIISGYFIMNILYCIKLKQIALVDVFIIATGFVLRVWIGGVATNIWISHWIILMTFLLALFIAFAKRRDDVVIYHEQGIKIRNNISRYNLQYMNQAITIIASVTIVCYIMYTVSPEVIQRMGTSYLYITSIWVILGILRYLQITIVDKKSGSPTKIILHDRFLQLVTLGWFITFYFIIYF